MGKKKKKTKLVRDQPQRVTKKRSGTNHQGKMDTRKKLISDDIMGRSPRQAKVQEEKRSLHTIDKDSIESGGISDDTIF